MISLYILSMESYLHKKYNKNIYFFVILYNRNIIPLKGYLRNKIILMHMEVWIANLGVKDFSHSKDFIRWRIIFEKLN